MKRFWICLAAGLSLAPTAWAGNVAHCEALIMQIIPSDDGHGEAQISSFYPAGNFLASLYDDEEGHLTEIDGFPIRAIMCRRNDIIPSEEDYPILASGLAFVLSQDFDRTDTDSLTLYWNDGKIEQIYKGNPLSEDAQSTLDARMADFSERGLNASARQAAEAKAAAKPEQVAEDVDAPESENLAVVSAEANTEIVVIDTDLPAEIEIEK